MQNWNIGDDLLDTRDIEDRIDDLEACEADYEELLTEYTPTKSIAEATKLAMDEAGWDFDERHELIMLREFRAELEGYCDWRHGETLIHEDFFEHYAEELATDIGAVSSDHNWPLQHIDWKAAAEDLKQDYTNADMDGSTYYARVC